MNKVALWDDLRAKRGTNHQMHLKLNKQPPAMELTNIERSFPPADNSRRIGDVFANRQDNEK